MNAAGQNVVDLKLTPLEARFVRAYMEHGNGTQAAKEAGCQCKSDDSFRARGSQLLKRLDGPIQHLMAEAGLTSLEILRSVAQGLNAVRETVNFDDDGKATVHESPDWPSRARFTEIAIRLKGGYPKPQLELPFEVQDGRVVITAEFATNTQHDQEHEA